MHLFLALVQHHSLMAYLRQLNLQEDMVLLPLNLQGTMEHLQQLHQEDMELPQLQHQEDILLQLVIMMLLFMMNFHQQTVMKQLVLSPTLSPILMIPSNLHLLQLQIFIVEDMKLPQHKLLEAIALPHHKLLEAIALLRVV